MLEGLLTPRKFSAYFIWFRLELETYDYEAVDVQINGRGPTWSCEDDDWFVSGLTQGGHVLHVSVRGACRSQDDRRFDFNLETTPFTFRVLMLPCKCFFRGI
jgi:hypothetical protein